MPERRHRELAPTPSFSSILRRISVVNPTPNPSAVVSLVNHIGHSANPETQLARTVDSLRSVASVGSTSLFGAIATAMEADAGVFKKLDEHVKRELFASTAQEEALRQLQMRADGQIEDSWADTYIGFLDELAGTQPGIHSADFRAGDTILAARKGGIEGSLRRTDSDNAITLIESTIDDSRRAAIEDTAHARLNRFFVKKSKENPRVTVSLHSQRESIVRSSRRSEGVKVEHLALLIKDGGHGLWWAFGGTELTQILAESIFHEYLALAAHQKQPVKRMEKLAALFELMDGSTMVNVDTLERMAATDSSQ